MEASKQYTKENGGMRISFNDGLAHTVKLIKDKLDTIPDGKGGTVSGMKYLVEEEGDQKTIFTGSIGLVSKLASCNEGDIVTIQMKKANNKSFFVVTKAGEEILEEGELPVISDDEEVPMDPKW